MAVVIADLKTSTNCFDCKLEPYVNGCPCYLGFENATDHKTDISPNCPLKEVPNLSKFINCASCLATGCNTCLLEPTMWQYSGKEINHE